VTTQDEMALLNRQIASVDRRVQDLEVSTERRLSSLDPKLVSIRESQAETTAQIDQLRNEIQEMGGRLEESTFTFQRRIERDTTELDAMRASLADLSGRVGDIEFMLAHLYEHLKLERPELPGSGEEPAGAIKEIDTEVTGSESQPVDAISPAPRALTAQETYDAAHGLFREGKYNEALASFTDFLKNYPQSELADNAQFWIGECRMGVEEYEQAILAYQEVITQYPEGNKVPAALLKQALAFQELNDPISAGLLLKKIVKTYPDSSEAKIAESKLKALQ
jgi:tol-pal system protein YbgF